MSATVSRQSVPFFWSAVVTYLAPGATRRGTVLSWSPWLREAMQQADREAAYYADMGWDVDVSIRSTCSLCSGTGSVRHPVKGTMKACRCATAVKVTS